MARTKKIKKINYTVEELEKLSTDTPVLFLQIIYANNWMKWIYDSDHENNAKLRYVREWYKKFTQNRL